MKSKINLVLTLSLLIFIYFTYFQMNIYYKNQRKYEGIIKTSKFDVKNIKSKKESFLNENQKVINAFYGSNDKRDVIEKSNEVSLNSSVSTTEKIENVINYEISEDEIQNKYNEQIRKGFYIKKWEFDVSHILVRDKNTAADLYERAISGESFGDLAEEYSICSSALNRGRLGRQNYHNGIKKFNEAAVKLENGEVSKPVKTEIGYHIIKMIKKESPVYESLERVRNNVLKLIQDERINKSKLETVNYKVKGKMEKKENYRINPEK